MTTDKQDREFDIIVVGATGYTGSLTATHIAEHLPVDLRWAIAGRSQAKLEALEEKLKQLSPNRTPPAIEIVSFDETNQVKALIGRAKVCISVVSYGKVGATIVEACIENKTDYIDTMGDTYRIANWIEAYHEKAKASGVALIHSAGAFSAPQDLLAWAAVNALTTTYSIKAKEALLSLKEMPADPSGGTVESLFNSFLLEPEIIAKSRQPWVLSPVKGSTAANPVNYLGLRHDAQLGILSAGPLTEAQDRAIVHRTWGLLDGGNLYGRNFFFHEYEGVPSTVAGLVLQASTKGLGLVLSTAVTRRIIRRFLPAPGEGPEVEKEKSRRIDMELVAIGDGDETKRAYSRFSFAGGAYHLTAAALAQGAASLLYLRKLEGGYSGGSLTPAFLGQDFINRLNSAGGHFETRTL